MPSQKENSPLPENLQNVESTKNNDDYNNRVSTIIIILLITVNNVLFILKLTRGFETNVQANSVWKANNYIPLLLDLSSSYVSVELDWFIAYLDGRKQCCKVNGKISKIQGAKCGVAQGSCLGPLLFLIYINDLPFSLQKIKVTMYADDTSISYSSRSVTDLTNAINSDPQDLSTWLQGNKLTLNAAKTA